jgi:hypothetical protein
LELDIDATLPMIRVGAKTPPVGREGLAPTP